MQKKTFGAWMWLAAMLLAVAPVAFVGCGDDEQQGCDTNADCTDGQLCVGNTCADVCEIADDCAGAQACSIGCPDTPQPICFISCESDEECAEGEFCNIEFCDGSFGRCEVARDCTSDDDCEDGICSDGACVECVQNDDCDESELCNDGVCVPRCTTNTECDVGQVCNADSGLCIPASGLCDDSDECGIGEVCDDGRCIPESTGGEQCTAQECYDEGNQYCAEVDEDESVCVDTSCGVAFNACTRCTLGPNSGSKGNGAPVIFFAEQVGNGCEPESNQCGEGARLFCKFSFHYFDPDDDIGTPRVFVVSGTGAHNRAFAVVHDDVNDRVEFGACFPDGASTPGTAAFLETQDGRRSNTLCVSGRR